MVKTQPGQCPLRVSGGNYTANELAGRFRVLTGRLIFLQAIVAERLLAARGRAARALRTDYRPLAKSHPAFHAAKLRNDQTICHRQGLALHKGKPQLPLFHQSTP